MAKIPKRLKRDPIVEALIEIRFQTDALPEVVIGKLVSHKKWANGAVTRLPTADIPAPIRNQDPALQVLPILEIRPAGNSRIVKIGERVLSYHVTKPYPGWGVFQPEIAETLDFVFAVFPGMQASRLGFRYINAFTTADHQMEGIDALNLRIEVSNKPVPPPINLNYGLNHTSQHRSLVRLASKEFATVPGVVAAALADIDIFTPDGVVIESAAGAKGWVDRAHGALKEEFFNLFSETMFKNLVEEW